MVKEKIRKFIQEELITDKNINLSEISDSLIELGIIDSLGIQQLIAFLESTFSIKINDDDLLPENFETIEAISNLVQNMSN